MKDKKGSSSDTELWSESKSEDQEIKKSSSVDSLLSAKSIERQEYQRLKIIDKYLKITILTGCLLFAVYFVANLISQAVALSGLLSKTDDPYRGTFGLLYNLLGLILSLITFIVYREERYLAFRKCVKVGQSIFVGTEVMALVSLLLPYLAAPLSLAGIKARVMAASGYGGAQNSEKNHSLLDDIPKTRIAPYIIFIGIIICLLHVSLILLIFAHESTLSQVEDFENAWKTTGSEVQTNEESPPKEPTSI